MNRAVLEFAEREQGGGDAHLMQYGEFPEVLLGFRRFRRYRTIDMPMNWRTSCLKVS
jgi:hypothetical protein